jgi:hypothetical protein
MGKPEMGELSARHQKLKYVWCVCPYASNVKDMNNPYKSGSTGSEFPLLRPRASFTGLNRFTFCDIYGSHSGEYEDDTLP